MRRYTDDACKLQVLIYSSKQGVSCSNDDESDDTTSSKDEEDVSLSARFAATKRFLEG